MDWFVPNNVTTSSHVDMTLSAVIVATKPNPLSSGHLPSCFALGRSSKPIQCHSSLHQETWPADPMPT